MVQTTGFLNRLSLFCVSYGINEHVLTFFSGTRKQLETALKDRVAALQSQCAQWSSDIERHSARLEVVRDSKHKQLREWMDAEGDLDVGQSEAMSEASTTVSNMSKLSQLSRMSTASAKRRKNVRVRFKVGSDCRTLLTPVSYSVLYQYGTEYIVRAVIR